ncbi:hypothetical protein TRVA0_006S00144 [Trichomonascus vanleenenianus]|uniref:uncharacterized protein n=1 Tax=Trichomonascus vanleenenianus TaxID=2268995 RepID=UPI003ECB8A75
MGFYFDNTIFDNDMVLAPTTTTLCMDQELATAQVHIFGDLDFSTSASSSSSSPLAPSPAHQELYIANSMAPLDITSPLQQHHQTTNNAFTPADTTSSITSPCMAVAQLEEWSPVPSSAIPNLNMAMTDYTYIYDIPPAPLETSQGTEPSFFFNTPNDLTNNTNPTYSEERPIKFEPASPLDFNFEEPMPEESMPSSLPTPPGEGLDFNGRKPRKWRNRKYKCSHCTKSFLDKDLDLYAQHVEEVESREGGIHLTRRKYKCADPKCPWHKIGFLRKLEAQKHYVRKHGVPRFECRFWSEDGEKIPGAGVCTTRWHADSGNRTRHELAIHGNAVHMLKASKKEKKDHL